MVRFGIELNITGGESLPDQPARRLGKAAGELDQSRIQSWWKKLPRIWSVRSKVCAPK
jgi:hypothetical protein